MSSKAVPSSTTNADEETLRTWANTYTRAVHQRTVCQETTMAKTGTNPHYLYTAKISEIAEATEEYSILLIVLTDVSTAVVKEKEVVIKEVQEDGNEKSDEFETSSDPEEELDNAHSNIATSTTDLAGPLSLIFPMTPNLLRLDAYLYRYKGKKTECHEKKLYFSA